MQFYSLTSGLNVFIGTCALVIFTGSSAGLAMGSFPDAEASTNSASDWFKHRWNMRSLGRGLNMLRLGKRDSISSLRLLKDLPLLRLGSVGGSSSVDGEDVDGAPVVSEQLLALLKEAVAQHAERDETRRQPPLPRYGRRSVGLNRRTVDSDPSNLFPFDFSTEDDPVYRPPPRGGRYKRALTGFPGFRSGQSHTAQELPPLYFPASGSDDETQQPRSVAFPRIGQFLQTQETQHDRRTKAVPHPRIGRDRLAHSVAEGSKQVGSSSDPMADPREV